MKNLDLPVVGDGFSIDFILRKVHVWNFLAGMLTTDQLTQGQVLR